MVLNHEYTLFSFHCVMIISYSHEHTHTLSYTDVECGNPPIPSENGGLQFTSTIYLSEAVYSCNDDCYRLIPDTPTLVCQANGEWLPNTSPVCESKSLIGINIYL